jgi:hypothetical protein
MVVEFVGRLKLSGKKELSGLEGSIKCMLGLFGCGVAVEDADGGFVGFVPELL